MPLTFKKERTAEQPAVGAPSWRGPMAAPEVPVSAPTKRRDPALAALAAVLMVGGALAGVLAFHLANQKTNVLEVVRPVAEGSRIVPEDLGVVGVSTSGKIDALSSATERAVVGRFATVPLAAGSLLSAADLSSTSVFPSTDALVGLVLHADQRPGGLAEGAHVDLVYSGNPVSGAAAQDSAVAKLLPGTVLASGTVVRVPLPPAESSSGGVFSASATQPTSNSFHVTVEVPRSADPVVAWAAAQGQVALVLKR
jgi:hypothetical protein